MKRKRSGEGGRDGNLSVSENEITNRLRRARHRDPHPNQWHMETKVPAIQTEQVEDDVASVTAEYVPAKASDEKHG